MLIDNSQAKSFLECPAKWQERYHFNLQPKRDSQSLNFGTRMHQLLEQRHKRMQGAEIPVFPALESDELEDEAQEMFALYEASYPVEPFEVVAVEQYFEVPLNDKHTYHGEFDAVVRGQSGRLFLFETKTESRSSKANLPEQWQSRSQVGLYVWAAEQLYHEALGGIILNVLTRRSPKGQVQCSFRRDNLERTEWQKREARENIIWIADQIEATKAAYRDKRFPQNRNACVEWGGWKCDYFNLHSTEERSEALVQIEYKQAEQYLAL